MSDARSLEERLAALEARSHIVDLLMLEAEYSRAWDFGDGEAWSKVFTVDGVFELVGAEGAAPMPGDPGQRFVGRTALAAFRDAFDSSWTMQHQMHLPSIKVEGDRATAVVYFDCPVNARSTKFGSTLQRETGVYRVEYVLGSEGWRITKRVEYPTFRATSRMLARPDIG